MGSSVTIVTAIASMAPGYTVYCPPVQSLYPFYINAPLYIVCQQALRQHARSIHSSSSTLTISQPISRTFDGNHRLSASTHSLLLCGLLCASVVNGGNFTYTGILQGAMFGFQFSGAVQDGDFDQIYNITSGQSGNAIATCNTTLTTTSCSTPVTYVMTGNYYELETFASSERNYTSGTQDSGYNYSIIVLPPVPSQPVMFIQYNATNQSTGSFVATSSVYSSQYQSAMTGCLLHYGKTPYQPSNVPSMLTGSSSLPSNAVTYMGIAQGTTQTITPASLPNPPVTQVGYDYHFSCYNGNGQSPDVILYNVSFTTSNSGNNNAAASRFGASKLIPALVGLAGLAVTAFSLLA